VKASRLATRAAIASALVMALVPVSTSLAEKPTPAPSFKVKDLRGKTLDLDALRRQGPVLVDFWATWCKPCLASLPELEALHQKYASRGLTVIGVSLDGPRNRSKVRPFVSRLRLTYPNVVDDDGRLQQLYNVLALPTALLIDTTGAIVKTRMGYRPGEGEEMEKEIRALLSEEAEEGAGEPDSSSGEGNKP
jgi:cytochrome c biogenesis protein CcmG/thiol:disulfide interchange protein DsbE